MGGKKRCRISMAALLLLLVTAVSAQEVGGREKNLSESLLKMIPGKLRGDLHLSSDEGLDSHLHAVDEGLEVPGSVQKSPEAEGRDTRGGGYRIWNYLVQFASNSGSANCVGGRTGRRDFTLAEDLLSYGQIPDAKYWPKFGFTNKMAIATVLGFVGAALANAGGVGGGGLFVPMFNLLLGFDAKTSAALSKAMVLGGSIASYSFNVQLLNPSGSGPLIDYYIALLLMPSLVLGISIGVMFNVIFPGWLIIALLTIFLAYTTLGVSRNGVKVFKKENELRQIQEGVQRIAEVNGNGNGAQQSGDSEEGERTPYVAVPPKLKSALARPHSVGGDLSTGLLSGYRNGRYARSADSGYQSYIATHEVGVHLLDVDDIGGGVYATPPQSPRFGSSPASPGGPRGRFGSRRPSFLMKMHMGEPANEPLWKMINWALLPQLVFIWILYFLLQIGKTHVALCGKDYWIINLLQIPVAVLATISGGYQMLQKQKAEALSSASSRGSANSCTVKWTLREIALYPFAALFAGTIGGLLGIGGGMVLGPVLLALKIPPQVTSATTSFMVIFSAAMSVTEFHLLGRIPLDFALYYSALCMVAALLGVSVVRALVVRSGRASIIIFVLAFVIGLSGIIIAVLGTAKIVAAYYAGAYMGFHSLCKND